MKPVSLHRMWCLGFVAVLGGTSAAVAAVDKHLPLLEQLMHEEMAQFGVPQGHQEPSRQQAESGVAEPNLLAIYGVGSRLAIEVMYDGTVLQYVSGQHRPLGWRSANPPLRLRGVTGRCVSLERGQSVLEACMPSTIARRRPAAMIAGGADASR